ncbi:hypothetical protein Kpol_1031p10 [Vanderwaltozyma polyspora DSM 70294]|uniref:non-specific serine/threonine protein kinase n=1 Tax=Vanderwaltozyma polyspora (strain ATCC 22028 / DSM 70294 / BCRC 21397 / CBS 2163 / NBRC 10782 / NRRL Y-8283 / UCD 57-17) TaxID=436907 RepID=A7THU4_VANPO|nr:uncharacterized protein Kpol_1031p10 [Vanderwaltozyma polyspora DSM 70294]EDO18106.1 hypothetical protein Kpol_1031p10 [Vanderwaltozyma polyspora DSM 70294]
MQISRKTSTNRSEVPMANNGSDLVYRSASSEKISNGDSDICSSIKRTEVIGRGKFGVVYKGYHLKTKHVYAIKVLNLDSDSDEVEDVQREIQFLASLKQVPNITRYYGSYLQDTNLWIIMEYCAGGSLRTLLRPGMIDEKYIGVIMRELLTALQCIHKDNVIHRDIKAANVLITNEGKVKLCDFGVAAQLNQTSLRRQTMAGTPYWMAPEVIMEGVYYDTKVDIWSLGITAYEIATGNPPYCEIEALRAMQLITKSKPARLEGRQYSSGLKEFIALCLDEDPKERLSAEELQKSKFIKAHKSSPTAILKELISRYLLFRDKTKSSRESLLLNDDQIAKAGNIDKGKAVGSTSEEDDKSTSYDGVDLKWDFDSLSSSEYIIENDINIDSIPEEGTADWSRPDNDQFNFAYPDEEQYYYYQTSNNTNTHNIRRNFQDSTMGNYNQGITMYNSTLNAPMSQANGTNNFTSKVMKTNHINTSITGTNITNTTSNRNMESRAANQLRQLFEENDVINEEVALETDIHNIPKSHSVLPSVSNDIQQSSLLSATPTTLLRPSLNILPTAYHSQSASNLPVIQNKNLQGVASVVTTAATPIEIEIPEELPVSALPTPSTSEQINETKARSTTISTPNPSHSAHPVMTRRLTVSGTGTPMNSITASRQDSSNKMFIDEGINGGGSMVNNSNTSSANALIGKTHRRTPTPPRSLLKVNTSISPSKKLTNSPKAPISSNGLPSMKPVLSNNDHKDLMLQPLNSSSSNTGVASNLFTNSTNDKEMSRATREFRRNNPNLKLQMPSPTTMIPTKLLDSATSDAVNNAGGNGTPNNENINQFGFNTSAALNIQVSMTPISEKHIDLGGKLKRSQSVKQSRSGSILETHGQLNPSASSNLPTPSSGLTSSSSIASVTSINTNASANVGYNSNATIPNNIANGSITNNVGNGPNTSSNSGTINGNIVSVGTNTASNNGNGNSGNNSLKSTSNSTVTSVENSTNSTLSVSTSTSSNIMQPPPKLLMMDLFSDFDLNSSHDYDHSSRWIDRKPQVLEELESLLKLYEEGLPVLENVLKKQLQKEAPLPTPSALQSQAPISSNMTQVSPQAPTIPQTSSQTVVQQTLSVGTPIITSSVNSSIIEEM